MWRWQPTGRSGSPIPDTAGCRASGRDPALGDHVYRYDARRQRLAVVAECFDKPNGLAFSPDGSVLYVGDSGADRGTGGYEPAAAPCRRLRRQRRPKAQQSRGIFATIEPGAPDGLKVDDEGRVYVSSASGVQVFAPYGAGSARSPSREPSTSASAVPSAISCSSPPTTPCGVPISPRRPRHPWLRRPISKERESHAGLSNPPRPHRGRDPSIADAAEKAAEAAGSRVYIAIVDRSGTVLHIRRTPSAQAASAAVAVDKARTAAIFVRPSREIEKQVSDGRLGALALAAPVR